MANTHKNDLQQRGMQTTAQAAQEKLQRKWLKQNPKRGEMIENLLLIEGKVNWHFNFILDSVPGLRDTYDARVKAEQEAAVQAQAPAPTPDAPAVEPPTTLPGILAGALMAEASTLNPGEPGFEETKQ